MTSKLCDMLTCVGTIFHTREYFRHVIIPLYTHTHMYNAAVCTNRYYIKRIEYANARTLTLFCTFFRSEYASFQTVLSMICK